MEDIAKTVGKDDLTKERLLSLQSEELWGAHSEIERRKKKEVPADNEGHEQFVARLHKEQENIRKKQVGLKNCQPNSLSA